MHLLLYQTYIFPHCVVLSCFHSPKKVYFYLEDLLRISKLNCVHVRLLWISTSSFFTEEKTFFPPVCWHVHVTACIMIKMPISKYRYIHWRVHSSFILMERCAPPAKNSAEEPPTDRPTCFSPSQTSQSKWICVCVLSCRKQNRKRSQKISRG